MPNSSNGPEWCHRPKSSIDVFLPRTKNPQKSHKSLDFCPPQQLVFYLFMRGVLATFARLF